MDQKKNNIYTERMLSKKQINLKAWIKQKWRTKSGKKSSDTGERYLPAKAIKAISDAEYKLTSKLKHKALKKGKQFSKQPKFIANKVKIFRDEWKIKTNNKNGNYTKPNLRKKLFIESFWPDIEFTNEIFMDVHHHRQFSRDGFVHNDFDPSEFSQNYYRGSDVGYKTCGAEACDNPDPNARYVQKSMACIYYVGDGPRINKNEPAGGHTAFFKDSKIEPFGGVEPVENRLVMFEISPISFHASRTNNTLYRDAIFGWHHSEMDYMQKKYPNEDLCKNFRGNFQPSMDNSYGNPVK